MYLWKDYVLLNYMLGKTFKCSNFRELICIFFFKEIWFKLLTSVQFNFQWAFISYKLPLPVLWVAFCPSDSRALHSHDSLFWQEFHTPDGTSITWLQTPPPPLNAPSLASETPLKPRTIIFLSFHPPHLRSRLPTAPSEPLDRSQPELLGFGQKSTARSRGAGVRVFSQLLGWALGAAC